MLSKLERKFGKYAIPRLMNYIIGGYIIGYILIFLGQMLGVDFLSYFTLDIYQLTHITNGFPIPQVWRIFTWLLIPPHDYNLFFGIIMMIFYWQIGSALERTWGTFRFNVFIFGGIILNILGAVLLNLIVGVDVTMALRCGAFFSTNYINLSLFLAFAFCYPDMQILLYFIIPIKMKYLAIIWGVLALLDVLPSRIEGIGFIPDARQSVSLTQLIASTLNFALFYYLTRSSYRVAKKSTNKTNRHRQFKAPNQSTGAHGMPKHKCCICGRTDQTNPELEFRFCSKCNGNYEYCQDHLFTHVHKK